MIAAKAVQKIFRSFGMNVTRLPANRFDAMSDVLQRLKRETFEPTAILDVGSNVGQWATLCTSVFPHTPLHMFEPQPSCHAYLNALAARRGNAELHAVLVSSPGVGEARVVGEGSTGAHVVADPARTDGRLFSASTLDLEMTGRFESGDRVLMKLDVEGHELQVLSGATAVLPHVEVIISEVTFFDFDNAGNTVFLQYANALDGLGFVLYDIAALASRARDGRLRVGDAVFARRESRLASDDRWA